MANKMKSQRLRAFGIENNVITQSNSGLLINLANKLNRSKAEDRRMQLNAEDIKREEDLISDFNVNGQNFFQELSGELHMLKMCRIFPMNFCNTKKFLSMS